MPIAVGVHRNSHIYRTGARIRRCYHQRYRERHVRGNGVGTGMRTVPSAWIPIETARERQVALLIHIFARRDGRVTLPNGWGSWTYSVGFQSNVNFTDLANYASDGIQSRTY